MTARDPIRLYAFALREGDVALADLLHARLRRAALVARMLRTLRGRLGGCGP